MSEMASDQESEGEVHPLVVESRPLPKATVLASLIEPFDDAAWELSFGQDVVVLPRAQLRDFAAAAKAAGFE